MIKYIHRVLEAQELTAYAKSEIEIALDKIGINQDNYDVFVEDGKASIEIANISPKASSEIKNKLPSLISTLKIEDVKETTEQQPVVNMSIIGTIEPTEEYEKINTPADEEILEDDPIDEVSPEETEEPSPSDKISVEVESSILDKFPDIETLNVEESISVPGTILVEGKTDPVTFKGIIDLLKQSYKDLYTVIGTNAYSYTTGNFQAGLVPN